MTPLLKIASIETLYYDRIYALHGLSLKVEEKEIFAVLGPNGAGKTTLLKTIAGLLKDQPKKGTIEFLGKRIHRLAPERISVLGIVYVPEDRGLFRELTVEENLDLGCWGRKDSGIKDDFEFIFQLFPILKTRATQQAETLSGGEQQMLAMARAMLRRPKLLMLDEPSLGLAPMVAHQVYDALAQISQKGTTILLVEQNARM
ncbi:MAG: ABC transporter ATP-binding protein, partial [Desulfatiglandales bacterium]